MESIKSVTDLFFRVGGSVKIAAALEINQATVDRWTRIGIPVKYWKAISSSFGIEVLDLFTISEKARRLHKKD